MNEHSSPPFELDPFALPQETRGRFRMFIAAAAALTWGLGAWWLEVPNLYSIDWWAEPELQKYFDRLKASADTSVIDSRAMELFIRSKLFAQLVEYLTFQVGRILLSLSFTGLIASLAWILYLVHPQLLSHRYGSAPLKSPRVPQELRRLEEVTGLNPPVVHLKPGFLDGVAFGRRGREILVLGGQRQFLERTWSPHTRAVALHEMGHIANGDIRTRTESSSLWLALATVLTGVGALALVVSYELHGQTQIPVFVPSFSTPTSENSLLGGGEAIARALFLLLPVFWLWSELIRAREFYADSRVATWGFRKPLLELLSLQQAPTKKGLLNRFHPSFADRIQYLEAPEKLFAVSRRLAFLSGLLLALVIAQMTPLVTDLTFLIVAICTPFVFLFGPLGVLLMPCLVFGVLCFLAYLVTGALGTQVQRESIAELVRLPHHRGGYLRLLRIALFFSLGLESGLLLSPFNPFTFAKTLLWVVAWIFILTFLVWLWLVFLRGSTRFLLGSAQTPSPNLRKGVTLISTILLAALLGSALLFRLAIEAGYNFEKVATLAPTGSNPVEFFVTMVPLSSFFLLAGALGLYLTLSLAVWLLGIFKVFLKERRCPHCSETAPNILLVGRLCRFCKMPLAPWPVLGEPS